MVRPQATWHALLPQRAGLHMIGCGRWAMDAVRWVWYETRRCTSTNLPPRSAAPKVAAPEVEICCRPYLHTCYGSAPSSCRTQLSGQWTKATDMLTIPPAPLSPPPPRPPILRSLTACQARSQSPLPLSHSGLLTVPTTLSSPPPAPPRSHGPERRCEIHSPNWDDHPMHPH